MEDLRESWDNKGPDKIIRDTLLTMANFEFKKKRDFGSALEYYECAHELRKTVLSGYSILTCRLKTKAKPESIKKALYDAIICAERSVDEGDLLDGGRFRMRRFLNKQSESQSDFDIDDLQKQIDVFEYDLWPWLRKSPEE